MQSINLAKNSFGRDPAMLSVRRSLIISDKRSGIAEMNEIGAEEEMVGVLGVELVAIWTLSAIGYGKENERVCSVSTSSKSMLPERFLLQAFFEENSLLKFSFFFDDRFEVGGDPVGV